MVGRTYRAANDLVPLIGINVAQETTRSQALRQSLVTRLHVPQNLQSVPLGGDKHG